MMENTIKIDDLGVPLFLETPIYSWWLKKKTFLKNTVDASEIRREIPVDMVNKW